MNPKRPAHCAAILAALSTLALPPVAGAQPIRMDPVVITATRTAQPASALLSDIRVIDSADIAAAGALSLLDLLQTQGGLEIATNGGPGQVAAVFLRGTNANHVVVLVDGVRVSSATTGTNSFETLPLNQIERIEILRGPASSLYGADAIGGVIQIFTRRDGNRESVSAGAGTYDTRRLAAGFSRSSDTTRLSVEAGYEESGAFSAANAGSMYSFDPDRDPFRNRNIGITFGHDWSPGHELSLRTLYSEGTAHFDAGPGSDDVNRHRLSSVALESRDQFSGAWTSTLRIARGTDDIETLGSFPGYFRTHQDQASWQNDLAAPGGRLALGLEYRHEDVASDTGYSATGRAIRSAFAGYSGSFGAHLLQASVRHDDNSQFGGRTTGNAGYGYRVTPAWRVAAAAGTAFKAPSFNDLYYVSPYFSGNPGLQPERARNGEVAIRYDSGGTRAGLTFFHNRIRDLIAVDPTFSTVINVNEARIRGATLDATATLADFRIKAELTRQDATDAATGNLLPRRARHFGTLNVFRTAGALRYGVEVVAAGARYDSLANTAASRLPGYALLNLRASYALGAAYAVSVRWNNVLDKAYELVQGYNTAGSNFLVSLDYATP